MKWPSQYAEQMFRALFPQYPNACAHAALDILVAAVAEYRQRDRELRERLDAAIPDWINTVKRHDQQISTFGT